MMVSKSQANGLYEFLDSFAQNCNSVQGRSNSDASGLGSPASLVRYKVNTAFCTLGLLLHRNCALQQHG